MPAGTVEGLISHDSSITGGGSVGDGGGGGGGITVGGIGVLEGIFTGEVGDLLWVSVFVGEKGVGVMVGVEVARCVLVGYSVGDGCGVFDGLGVYVGNRVTVGDGISVISNVTATKVFSRGIFVFELVAEAINPTAEMPPFLMIEYPIMKAAVISNIPPMPTR